MPARAVIGGQWGDEGKGKIVDFMAQDADIVVRYAGGGNAGHSVENEMGKFALRTIPCGIVNSGTQLNIIGRGTVPEIGIVVDELKALVRKGVDICRLRIDEGAHLVMPWHIFEDKLEEDKKEKNGENQIGTTKNGIGPCYADKIKRIGFRAGDLLDLKKFKKRFLELHEEKVQYFSKCFDHFDNCLNGCEDCMPMRDPETSLRKLERDAAYLRRKFSCLENLICDTRPILWDALDKEKNILLEGAQGFMLDIDHGTYPYVTSSCTGVASAAQGSGVPVNEIKGRIGVFKAYTSRVGEGAMPTQMAGRAEQKIREIAHEYGTVTGRPRRLGWFDTVAASEVIRTNGLTDVAITRLDILDDLPLIGVGMVDAGGKRYIDWVPGWCGWVSGGWECDSVRNCRTWKSLPEAAKEYCKLIACGVPIKYISVGPAREETIVI